MAGFLTPEREAILRATVREWASTGCDPYPCGAAVWRYANAMMGKVAPDLPDHSTRKAMATLLLKEGGLPSYARSLMERLQWREVADPARGDVGVVDIAGMGITCAIYLGRGWMAKGAHRVVIVPAPHVAAWRLEPCHKPLVPPSSPQSA